MQEKNTRPFVDKYKKSSPAETNEDVLGHRFHLLECMHQNSSDLTGVTTSTRSVLLGEI